jgi:topoisomerase-4 subunit A
MARPSPHRAATPLAPSLGEIDHRLEVLAGMLIVFLNLDEVIRIIREEDEPKDVLRSASSSPKCRPITFSTRACARCASSRKCSCAREFDELTKEKAGIEDLLADEGQAVEDHRLADRD